MKKKLILSTTLFLSLILSACGGGREGSGSSSKTSSSTSESSQASSTSDTSFSSTSSSSGHDVNIFDFTFKNYDETTLQVVNVEKGGTAIYSGPTPTRPSTIEGYRYKFANQWTTTNGGSIIASLENIRSNQTVYAKYDLIEAKYTVNYYDRHGNLLMSYPDLAPNSNFPMYYGPDDDEDFQHYTENHMTYYFEGWDINNDGKKDSINKIKVNQDYYARPVYNSIPTQYEILFLDENGNLIANYYANYGTNLHAPEMSDEIIDERNIRTFLGWDINNDGEVDQLPEKVEGNLTAKAVYKIETRKYTITYYTENDHKEIYYVQEGEYEEHIIPPAPMEDTQPEEGYVHTHTGWHLFRPEGSHEIYMGLFSTGGSDWDDLVLNYNYFAVAEYENYFIQCSVTVYANEEQTEIAYQGSREYSSIFYTKSSDFEEPTKEATISRWYELIGYNVTYDPNYHGQFESNEVDFVEKDSYVFIFCDVTLTPVFETHLITKTVKFYEFNGSYWYESCSADIEAGTPAVYPNGTPVSVPSQFGRELVFDYWTSTIEPSFISGFPDFGDTPVTEDISLYAQYKSEYINFTVSYYNEDGTELLYTQNNVTYISTNIDAPNPSKDDDNEFTYTFSHWSETIGGSAFTIGGHSASFSVYAVFSRTLLYIFDNLYSNGYWNIATNGDSVYYFTGEKYDEYTRIEKDEFIYNDEKLSFTSYESNEDNRYGYASDGYCYNITDVNNITRVYDKKIQKLGKYFFLDDEGDLYCHNKFAPTTQVPGSGQSYVKLTAPTGVKFIDFADNSAFIIAVSTDHDLYAMGYNNFSYLGNGTTSSELQDYFTKIEVDDVKFASCYVGTQCAFALAEDGTLYGWGKNTRRNLGIGNDESKVLSVPTIITNEVKFKTIYVSHITNDFDVCAISIDGKYYCWGWNYYFELGVGNLTSTSYPVHVPIYDEDGVTEVEVLAVGNEWYYTTILASNNRMYSSYFSATSSRSNFVMIK